MSHKAGHLNSSPGLFTGCFLHEWSFGIRAPKYLRTPADETARIDDTSYMG